MDLNGNVRGERFYTGVEEREIQFGVLNIQLIPGIAKMICGQKATIKDNIVAGLLRKER